MADGWSGFTGTVEEEDPATPVGVPVEYVMQPFSIRLAFRGRHWLTVAFEIGHDEIGSTKHHDLRIADDLITLFESLGLETPAPIPVLALDHQIAQKLHACTYVNPKTGQNDRAHDLVDLQILEQEETIDMAAVAATAKRLFAARREHDWPPTVVQYDRWDTIYAEAATGLDVIDSVADAVTWTNDFIARAVEQGS
ncbi:MAG TPA: nucleotidyl transferase AbiEii/AbiGii toxin family protein [Ilumatobacteraceae bacterium]|nr:nucleotidyl transferase AbiEii/AbiGii toxin family protein [Ilumatobacteraceae bacterium]